MSTVVKVEITHELYFDSKNQVPKGYEIQVTTIHSSPTEQDVRDALVKANLWPSGNYFPISYKVIE